MLSSILFTLCFVPFGFILVDSNGAGSLKQGEGQEWIKNHILEKWQVAAANDKTKTARQEEDFVTGEEFDEAVSTLTSMIDVLSVQIMGINEAVLTNTNNIATVMESHVKRCESGTMQLFCEPGCCYMYPFGDDCILRASNEMHFAMTFQQAFSAVPVLSMSAVKNAGIYPFGQLITEGFWYWADKSMITTSGFDIGVGFAEYDMYAYHGYYTFNWIACV